MSGLVLTTMVFLLNCAHPQNVPEPKTSDYDTGRTHVNHGNKAARV